MTSAEAHRKKCRKWHAENREARKLTLASYRRSLAGHIIHRYASMKQRVEGRGTKRSIPLYEGLELLPRADFIEWASKDRSLLVLHREWVRSGYSYKLTPSINRVDNSKGYVLGNMEWVTKSQNSTLGALQAKEVRRSKNQVLQSIERAIHASAA